MSYAFQPNPPIPAHEVLIFLLQIATLLLVAVVLGRVAERFKMPAIVGELFTGVLLGPSLLGAVAPAFSEWLLPHKAIQSNMLDAVGLLGILLLVGITGAHLDLGLIRRRGITAVRISLCGLLLPLGAGIALAYALPAAFLPDGVERTVFALFLGVAMCVSAIPVIAKTLVDMRLLHRDVGQLTIAAGTVDDAVGWLLLSIVSAMATVGLSTMKVSLSVLYLLGFILFAVLVGRPLVNAVMRLANRSENRGTTVAVVAGLMILGGSLTHALGMEPVFGAFAVGILIGRPGVVDPERLAPLRTVVLSVLAPIFLATAGLRIDLTVLGDPTVLGIALAVLAVAIAGKFVGAYLGAWMSGLNKWEGLALGAGLNARGVVEVVVAMVGLRVGVLDTKSYTIIVLVAVVTSLMAPPILRYAMTRVNQNAEEQARRLAHEAWSTPVYSAAEKESASVH
ncbi:cation:proton antiporter [Catellatospora sp. NPDC049609]|uniref:cation:proton antiporter n=1 Tax=Catellatospora sp. NPDC049609 TaxID=3155505 RepID=UPI00342C341A